MGYAADDDEKYLANSRSSTIYKPNDSPQEYVPVAYGNNKEKSFVI